ncbi:AraC family transcriptional regulator [Kordiimonas sediminis]|uniref:AraC family transcriptional regulator n=1 Tax=Kordiimonas sediminis TaxID=1735581 RepID=A0A919E8R3_9PROT|nr:AraC family transcriptional regulator [Kordiimonas sediminis]GHF25853.1 AraC family transcriptional regulator [Kordiimonas sediminis]
MEQASDIAKVYAEFNEAFRASSVASRGQQYSGRAFNDATVWRDGQVGETLIIGNMELSRISDGMLVCITKGNYDRNSRQQIMPSSDLVSIRFVLSGNYWLEFKDMGRLQIPQACASLQRTRSNANFDLVIASHSEMNSVTIHFKPQFLIDSFALQAGKMPSRLANIIFGREEASTLYEFPLSSRMMTTILSMLHISHQGSRRNCYIQAKATELICQFFGDIEQSFTEMPKGLPADLKVKSKIFEAQRLLVENYAKPPTIRELSRRVGLNRSTICTEFKQVFNKTIFEFCQDYRMNKANEMLQDRHLTVAQVAAQVGYGHATNFTVAYKKKFGRFPKESRNR